MCQRFVSISWLTGTELLHRSTFMVPAPIVAYNQSMNSVDCMDQRRAVNPTRRYEKRLHISIFMHLLVDLEVHNAYAAYYEADFFEGELESDGP